MNCKQTDFIRIRVWWMQAFTLSRSLCFLFSTLSSARTKHSETHPRSVCTCWCLSRDSFFLFLSKETWRPILPFHFSYTVSGKLLHSTGPYFARTLVQCTRWSAGSSPRDEAQRIASCTEPVRVPTKLGPVECDVKGSEHSKMKLAFLQIVPFSRNTILFKWSRSLENSHKIAGIGFERIIKRKERRLKPCSDGYAATLRLSEILLHI